MNSTYIRLEDRKTSCPLCFSTVTLLQDQQIRRDKPMFYICWTCRSVMEVGKGKVHEEI